MTRNRYRSHRFRAATMAFVIVEIVLIVRAARDAKRVVPWWLADERRAA